MLRSWSPHGKRRRSNGEKAFEEGERHGRLVLARAASTRWSHRVHIFHLPSHDSTNRLERAAEKPPRRLVRKSRHRVAPRLRARPMSALFDFKSFITTLLLGLRVHVRQTPRSGFADALRTGFRGVFGKPRAAASVYPPGSPSRVCTWRCRRCFRERRARGRDGRRVGSDSIERVARRRAHGVGDGLSRTTVERSRGARSRVEISERNVEKW